MTRASSIPHAGMCRASSTGHTDPHGTRRALRCGVSPASTPLLVSGHVASTLGESLNSLLILMALAMRLKASFSLPWLPQHQYFVPSGLCHWYYDVAQDGIDLREVINMTRLGSVLPVDFNNDERCLANNSGSRVAIQIHRHGAHWIRPDYFAPSGTIAQNTTPQSLHLPKLDSMGGFDSAIQAIHTLRRRYRGYLPVTILVRMDDYPELSCGLWGLAQEVLRLMPHIELVRPPAPSITLESVVDEELSLSGQCGYVFFRGSATMRLSPTVASSQTIRVSSVSPEVATFQSYAHLQTGAVDIDKAARSLSITLKAAGCTCAFLDFVVDVEAEKKYGKFPLVGALGRHGVRVFDWRVPAAYKLVPSPRWLRPPMTENLLKLFYARHSRLFIAERGSCWPDLVTMIRSEHKQPSMTMRAGKKASLLLDTVPRCVRVRGTCTDPTAPFPYREGAC